MQNEYPFLLRNAADAEFLSYIAEFIDRNEDRFTPNKVDPERRKWMRMSEDGKDPVIASKKMELISLFAIGDWVPDPTFDDLIGYITEGGVVHPHTDPASDGRMHIRINLLVSKPQSGCIPLLDGIPIDVGLGDAWICFASHCRHATTAVVGSRRRSIISYGLQVDRRSAFPLFSKYLTWKAAYAGAALTIKQ